ncbi:aromatic ring hydroxylase, partial [bacterium]|nr:aromatic ring hydroxylase [bacterium]
MRKFTTNATNISFCPTKEINQAIPYTPIENLYIAIQRHMFDACAQTDTKGDRSKRPHEQKDPDAYVHIVEEKSDGIIVRGAKVSITMAPVADEIIVVPTRALTEKDRDYAVAFAIPADW